MRKEKSCGAVVYHKPSTASPKILLIKHRNGGHWSFPKGHVENDETEKQTALREIKEETGLDVQLLDGFREVVFYKPKPNTQKEVVYFVAKSKTAKTRLQKEEISRGIWVDFDKALSLVTYENDKVLIRGAKEFIADEFS